MFAILNILSVPFCGIKYTYTVVQPSPLSLSRSFLSFKLKLHIHEPLTPHSPYPRPLMTIILLSVSIYLTTLLISYKWNYKLGWPKSSFRYFLRSSGKIQMNFLTNSTVFALL